MITSRRNALKLAFAAALAATGCSAQEEATNEAEESAEDTTPTQAIVEDSTTGRQAISDSTDNGHAIAVSGEMASYLGVDVTKTGDADGDEADFYGTNAAVYAEEGATLDLVDVTVTTDGTHANAVFSYGEGTTVNVSDSTIRTSGNCSGGIMVTGGSALNATNLDIHTTGNSSAAIRSDRGGGTQNVAGGTYVTEGTGSPVIYSTADVKVSGATLESTASQGVVVEGKNSVELADCQLTACNTTKNSDKSNWYQAVMVYQSMSGDAAEGEARFSMSGGSLANLCGDVLFVNNTVATVELAGVDITNEDPDGVLLRAAAAGWGSEGSNGGHVTLTLANEALAGDVVVDDISELNLYLKDGTAFAGAINNDDAGAVYVEVEDGSTWTLTGDSFVDALTCEAGGIDLNGFVLTVGGATYQAGSASTGEAVEFTVAASGGGMGGAPDGMPGEPPDGMGGPPEGEPPTGGPGGGGDEPPAKPDGSN